MKNQYFGDINDFRKYGLLIVITNVTKQRIGVCWMLTEDDGSRDGQKRNYLSKHHEFEKYDPALFKKLSRVQSAADCNVRNAEKWNLIPNARYFTDVLHDDTDRTEYFRNAFKKLADCPIIFFDPDNGIEVKSVKYGRKKSSKFVYWRELKDCYEKGHSMVIYQHYPRIGRDEYHRMMVKRLREETGCSEVMTMSSSHVVFFLVSSKKFNSSGSISDSMHAMWSKQISCKVLS